MEQKFNLRQGEDKSKSKSKLVIHTGGDPSLWSNHNWRLSIERWNKFVKYISIFPQLIQPIYIF